LDLVVFRLKIPVVAQVKYCSIYISKSTRARKAIFFSVVRGPLILVNAVKRLPPSPKVGATGAPKLVSRAIFSKISLFAAVTVPKFVALVAQKVLICTGEVP